MEITTPFFIHQTVHWRLDHHQGSTLPGYLMLGAKTPVSSLADLPDTALAELGGLLARTQRAMETVLAPKWLYISRFGHVCDHPFHLHFIPVYHWVEELFWQDSRYRLLETFATPGNALSATDGAELTLFIWREFGERNDPPPTQGPSISEVIQLLRDSLNSGTSLT